MRIMILNGSDGCHKCIHTRQGRLSWENYLGRLEHGGWDSMMTSVMEIYDESVESDAGRDLPDDKKPVSQE